MRPFIIQPKPNCCTRRLLSKTAFQHQHTSNCSSTNNRVSNKNINDNGKGNSKGIDVGSSLSFRLEHKLSSRLATIRTQEDVASSSYSSSFLPTNVQSRHYSTMRTPKLFNKKNNVLVTSTVAPIIHDKYYRRDSQIRYGNFQNYSSSSILTAANGVILGDDDLSNGNYDDNVNDNGNDNGNGNNNNDTRPISSDSQLITQTERILNESLTPIGSFTASTMEHAVKLMEEWTLQSESNNSFIHSATQITRLLHRIILENQGGNPQAYFHTAMAESACLYWRKISPEQCPRQTLQIISWMRDSGVVEERFMPYNNMISILTKCRNRQAALAVQGLLYRMIALEAEMQKSEEGQDDDIFHMDMTSNCRPDVITYNSAIATWMHIARSEDDAGDRAVEILNQMKVGYRMRSMGKDIGGGRYITDDDDKVTTVKPNILSFSMAMNTVLRAKKKKNASEAALQAEDLLQDLIYFHRDTWKEEDVKEAKRSFDNVFEALNQCAHTEPEAAQRSVKLLRFMENAGIEDLLPDTKTYNTVIGALAKQLDISSIFEIKDIITDMTRNHDAGKNKDAKVTTQTYNALIKAYVKHGQEASAESILLQMQDEHNKGNDDVRPDSVTWNLVIEAHAKSQDERAAHKTAIIMDKMVEFGKKHPDVKPDKVTITSMLKSLVRKAVKGNKNVGQQAVNILDKIIESYRGGNELMKPDKIIFSTVINCVAKCGKSNAGIEALLLLNRMQKMHEEGLPNLKPDTVTLNTTLSALANTQTAEAADQAGKLLQAMLRSNDEEMAANVQSYTLVISAWAKSGARESTEKIEQLLLEMEKVDNEAKPNHVTYSTVLNAFAKSTDPSSYDRATRVLKRMEDGAINVVPNAFCYASVMECISKSRDRRSISSKALDLLQRLCNQSASRRSNKDSYTVVFNTAIKALEKSSEKRKDKVAQQFLSLMREGHESEAIKAPLNVRTYNAVIRACVFTIGSGNDKREAFIAAFDTLKELRSATNVSPDLYTYPAMVRASEELLGRSDYDLEQIRSIFTMCCEDGLVDALLLKNMVNFLPKDFMRSLLCTENKEPSQVRLNDLPREWKSNIYNKKSDGRRSGKKNN